MKLKYTTIGGTDGSALCLSYSANMQLAVYRHDPQQIPGSGQSRFYKELGVKTMAMAASK